MNISSLFSTILARLEFIRGERDYEIARIVLPFFYYFLFFSSFLHLEGLNVAVNQGGEAFSALWPLFWTAGMGFESVVTTVLVGSVLSSLLAAVFPFARSARVAGFLGILFYHAYLNSFGDAHHQFDYVLWIAFILIFLPSTRDELSRESRRIFSLVFWSAQAYLLLTYSMAGTLKVLYGFVQMFAGEAHVFAPDAGVLHIATQLLRMHETVPLAPFLVAHPLLVYVPMLLVLYIQFFALLAAFRPHLHRLWGVSLALFHVGTFLSMRAVFTIPAILLMIFLISSPFAPRASWREIFQSLPLVPSISKLFYSMSRAFKRHASTAESV